MPNFLIVHIHARTGLLRMMMMVLVDATRKKLLLLIEAAGTKMVGRLADAGFAVLAEPVAEMQRKIHHLGPVVTADAVEGEQ